MSTKYTLADGKEVIVQPLTFGYIDDVENGIIEDNIITAIMDATGLDSDTVRAIRRPDAVAIFEIIKKETYPELYDEDGNEKELTSEETNKKKV